MRTTVFAGWLVVAVGCGDSLAMGETGTTSTGAGSSGDGLGGSVTGGPTGGEPTGGESTAGDTGSGASVTVSSSSGGGESSSDGGGESSSDGGESDTGEPASGCASACDRLGVHDGNLLIEPGDPTDWLKCVTRVTGHVLIHGDIEAEALAGLADLQQVDGDLSIGDNTLLTDLSPLACVKTVGGRLSVSFMSGLTTLSGLESIALVRRFYLRFTGVPELGGLPPLAGVEQIDLFDNPELSDLAALAGWEIGAVELVINAGGNAKLVDLSGFAGPLAQVGDDEPVVVQLFDSPGLLSLEGLEGLTHGSLTMMNLPMIADLEPLVNFTEAGSLSMSGMPLVTTLHGLRNLETVQLFSLGDCVNGGPEGPGMAGLKDLSGLDALVSADGFGIANNAALTGLGGAPLLKQVNAFEVVGNTKLTQAAVDGLLAQLDAPPNGTCFGSWDQCSCFQFLPW